MRELIAVGDNFRLDHFAEKVVAFTCTLADAGEHGEAFTSLRDVVDQLHNEHGLADTGTAKEADLSAAEKWLDQVDDLDTSLEHLELCRLLCEIGSMAM